jgi:hypothetical protein
MYIFSQNLQNLTLPKIYMQHNLGWRSSRVKLDLVLWRTWLLCTKLIYESTTFSFYEECLSIVVSYFSLPQIFLHIRQLVSNVYELRLGLTLTSVVFKQAKMCLDGLVKDTFIFLLIEHTCLAILVVLRCCIKLMPKLHAPVFLRQHSHRLYAAISPELSRKNELLALMQMDLICICYRIQGCNLTFHCSSGREYDFFIIYWIHQYYKELLNLQ